MKKIMIQCAIKINKSSIKRKNINGVEHIIVNGKTLPFDIVMNNGLYPEDEIKKSYKTLERTLAPVEHPTDQHGNYISASDPIAIHNFHAGAFCENVRIENDSVAHDFVINVVEAKKTDRGKRLLDRIEELENNEKPRPIHTSVGAFLEVEQIDSPRTNSMGLKYNWIARNIVYDHNAILLDSVGAATPAQGVGMAVNNEGHKVSVDRAFVTTAIKAATNLPLAESRRTWNKSSALRRVKAKISATDMPNQAYARYHLWYDAGQSENFGAYKLPFVDIVEGEAMAIPAALRNAAARLSQTDGPSAAEKTRIGNIIDGYLNKLRANQMSMSYTQMIEQLEQQIKNTVAADYMIIEDVYEDHVIFETGAGYFTVPYTVSGDSVTLAGIPVRVDKMVEYQPKVNRKTGDEQMKELIINALAEAGISTDGLSDDALFAAYNELMTSKKEPDPKTDQADIVNAVNAAMAPITEQIKNLTAQVNASAEKAKGDLIQTIVNSKKYPGMTEDAAKLLPVDTLKEMAANCTQAHGIPLNTNADDNSNAFAAPVEMPE